MRLTGASAILALLAAVLPAQQAPVSPGLSTMLFAGSDGEDYLRSLQSLRLVGSEPWSIRPFTQAQLARLAPAPAALGLARAAALDRSGVDWRGIHIEVAPVEARMWYNSAFAFGTNDGVVWAGRGATLEASGGVAATWGPMWLTVAPVAFWAQNQRFTMVDNGFPGDLRYGDKLVDFVDRPQRFGVASYGRVDAGQTGIGLEGFGFTVGASNADQWWGPMSVYPYILGNNAGGFPHLFVGSSRAINIYVGRLSWRILYGDLRSSAYGFNTVSGGRRFASGGIGVFQPRFMPGLEVGASRFYHLPWPDSGLTSAHFTHIFESLIKEHIKKLLNPDPGDPNQSQDNQLASVFFRWNPGPGFELYGEYGREDHNWDARDLIAEIDHTATVGFGVRKSWQASPEEVTTLLLESMNFDASGLKRHRGEGGIFIHYYTKSGHTLRGQLLSTGFAAGAGSGFTARLDRVRPAGSSSALFQFNRYALDQMDTSYVVQAVGGVRRSLLRGPRELSTGLTAVYEFNRNYTGDALNWRLDVSMRYHLGRGALRRVDGSR